MNQLARKEAKAKGLTHYFTGVPCLRGHVVKRLVSTCQCLECVRLACAQWRSAEKERVKEIQAKYYKKNRKKINEGCRQYYWDNRAKRRTQGRLWHLRNKKAANERSREWRAKNKEAVNSYTRTRRARRFKNGGKHTGHDVMEIFKMQKRRCAYCRDKLSAFQVDHIQPLSRGGDNGRQNLQLLCAECNLRKHGSDPIVYAQSLGMLL